MNGFHSDGRDIRAQEIVRTIGKKIANWTVGNSIDQPPGVLFGLQPASITTVFAKPSRRNFDVGIAMD